MFDAVAHYFVCDADAGSDVIGDRPFAASGRFGWNTLHGFLGDGRRPSLDENSRARRWLLPSATAADADLLGISWQSQEYHQWQAHE